LIPWIGKNVLQLENDITQFSGGSGDTTYDYVLLLFFIFCSLLGSILWTFIEKKEKNYEKLNYIFTVIIAYYLGAMMLSYGLGKVIPPRQFSELNFYRLLQPYGDSSPMGLLWTFMGASQGYTIFSGLAETIGGLLLFHRRTRLLGSLILIPVLVNVVALNFFYDVPVKLFSIQLLLFAIFLILPNLKRLLKVIVTQTKVESKEFKDFFNTRKAQKTYLILKCLLLAVIIGFLSWNIVYIQNWANENGYGSKKPLLYGVYKVLNENSANGKLSDWSYLRIQYDNYAHIHKNDSKIRRYETKIDTTTKQITLTHETDSIDTFTLKYKELDSIMIFSKMVLGDTLDITTKQMKESDFPLVGRGFHWINEYPNNH
jgi:hypothetical protein